MPSQPVDLSIVTSLFRSAAHLDEFHARCTAAAGALTSSYEIVLVNDGSADDSLRIALDIHKRDPRVRVIDLSRNFGHHKALMTGLARAAGELVFLIAMGDECPDVASGHEPRGDDVRRDGLRERLIEHPEEQLTRRTFEPPALAPLLNAVDDVCAGG